MGGYEFTKEYTGIYKITVPEDNFVWSAYKEDNDGNTWALIGNKIIDWGDGNVTTGIGTHLYAKAGDYVIKGNTRLGRERYGSGTQVRKCLTEVVQFPTSVIALHEFYLCTLMTKANLSGCTLSGNCFRGCWTLKEINLTNTTFTGDVGGMFEDALLLTEEGLIGWNTITFNKLTNFRCFFKKTSITSIDISALAQNAQLTAIESMFQDSKKLTTIIGLDKIDTSRITNMGSVFYGCSSLTSLDLSSWNVSKVSNMINMFYNCSSLVELNLTGWTTSSLTGMGYMFGGCSSLQKILGIENFNISKVTSLDGVFSGCGLTSINLDSWDFNGVTNVYNMFAKSKIKTLDTTNWDVSTITNFGNFCNGATCEYITLTFSGSMWAVMHTCTNVKHVTWKNCTVTIDNYSFPGFNNSANAEWQITFDNAIISAENGTNGILSNYKHLTVESLMSVINALADRTGMDGDTLTLGSVNLAKLTPEQIKIATDKNWTVV